MEQCYSLEHIVIPKTVKRIEMYAFYDCTGMTSVTLGEGLEEIGKGAFRDCRLLGIITPNAVKMIKEGAFSNCADMTDVTLGKGLEEIGGYCICKLLFA